MKVGWVATAMLAFALFACTPVSRPTMPSVVDTDPLRRELVADVVGTLDEVYEASDTVLVPARAAGGAFDTALLAALRAKRFTLVEPGAQGDSFDWQVEPVEGSMYRVTVVVDRTTLSRLWVADGVKAYPGGAWTRRE